MQLRKFTLPESIYYSDSFRALWDEMMESYAFHDSTNERTVKNYGSSVKLICDHCKKDFTELTDTDVEKYFAGLDEAVAKGELAESTAGTYKKNLRSVGNLLERRLREQGTDYHSPFLNKVHVKRYDPEEKNRIRQENREKRAEEASVLLELIKENEAPQYYFIFCMMAYFDRITPIKICEMRVSAVEMIGKRTLFRFFLNLQRPKTQVAGRKISEEQAEDVLVKFHLPEEIDREFRSFYPAYRMRIAEKKAVAPEMAFHNRNYQPVNFKTLGTIFRKNLKLLQQHRGATELLSIRDLCGALFQSKYVSG